MSQADVLPDTHEALHAAIDNVLDYMEGFFEEEETPKKHFTMSQEFSNPESECIIIKPSVGAHQVNLQIKYKEKEEEEDPKLESCVGLMQSPFWETDAKPQEVKIVAFGDLIDYMVLHLCPALCVPRALYYLLHVLNEAISPDMVDQYIAISENNGNFVVCNKTQSMEVVLKLNPQFVLCVQDVAVPLVLTRPHPPLRQGCDYLEHAFARDLQIKSYEQHPAVLAILRRILLDIGLNQMHLQIQQALQEEDDASDASDAETVDSRNIKKN